MADYLLELPLSTLAGGDYLLAVEAMRADDKVRSDIRFTVR